MRTVLAFNGLMCSSFMLVPISLGYYISTLPALVVVTSATYLMHSELAHFDGALTRRAHLCFFLCRCFCHSKLVFSFLKMLEASFSVTICFSAFFALFSTVFLFHDIVEINAFAPSPLSVSSWPYRRYVVFLTISPNLRLVLQ